MNFDFDLHTHTFHSPCGHDEMLPAELVRTAASRGITRLGITDHFYPFTDTRIFEEIKSAVLDTQSKISDPPEVYLGCEVEIMAPGSTAGSAELAESLDFVMVAATHFQNTGITDLPPGDNQSRAEYYLRMFEYAVSLPWADVLAHPFFVVPGVCSPEILKLITDSDLRSAVKLAGENGVAMEISRRVFTTQEQLEFSLRFYRLCKKLGLKFTLGSDAHALIDLGNVHMLKPLVAELGLRQEDFWLPQSKVRLEMIR